MKIRIDAGFALKAAISSIVIAILIYFLDLQQTVELLLHSKIELVTIALLLVVVQIALSAFKVGLLVNGPKKLGFGKLLRYYCFGWAAGLVSVGKIGEFSMSYYLKKEGMPYSRSLAAILTDKIITFLALATVTVAGTLLFFGTSNLPLLSLSAIFVAGVGIFLLALKVINPSELAIVKAIKPARDIVAKYNENITAFRGEILEFFSKKRELLAINAILSIARLCLMSITGSLLFLAINSSIDPLFMGFIIAVTAIVALLPITLSGLGVVEITFVYLASLQGISAEAAIATQILTLAINYSIGLVISAIWAINK
ncbi:MAG TPA: flippase-like domain-containing protein [Candidatus Diapherotrites archaeon]|uniref:Flippase-like domain-containing protein n=1 Tax=Candidatus Iainarchaeum sp. TaxID=3101447 RepID=A0A7J4IVM2_9ARCH|nr:flippase-like domain-containing protein [Candidatus Diapherotrites archaeon]